MKAIYCVSLRKKSTKNLIHPNSADVAASNENEEKPETVYKQNINKKI